MTQDLVVFRCDSGATTGLGHLSRCLALAEALRERDSTALFIGDYSTHALALLKGAGVDHVASLAPVGSTDDVAVTLDAVTTNHALGLVVDSYAVDAGYLATLSARAGTIFIDDLGTLPTYRCAAVLNFTARALHLAYPRGSAVQLIGPTYLLVRRAVRRVTRRPPEKRTRRVLIALGGAGGELTMRVLDALERIDVSLDVCVVVRPDDRKHKDIERHMRPFRSSRVLTGLDHLAEPYTWADVCITGGGLMKYEASSLGLPTGVLAQTVLESDDVLQCAALGFVLDLGGPDVSERPLGAPLASLIEDHTVRRALHAASSCSFAGDTTARAADAVLSVLRDRDPCATAMRGTL